MSTFTVRRQGRAAAPGVDTTRYWPHRVERPEDVPPAFERELADPATRAAHVVYAPAPGSLFSAQKEHLVVLDEDTVTVHTAQGERRSLLSTSLREIELLEWGSVLLHSWVRIWTGRGSATVHFNSVRDDLFRPLIVGVRRALWPADDRHALRADHAGVARDEAEKLRRLRPRSVKFANYGSRCLTVEERVVSTLFQEPFSTRVLRRGRFIPLRWHVFPHLTILTDRELILLREENQLALVERAARQYGCVHTFVASSRIGDIDVDEHDDFRELVVRTTAGETIRSRFACDNPELPGFLQAVRDACAQGEAVGRLAARR